MSSGRQALTIVGQLVGATFGPIGAVIGGAIGGEIGGAIDGPQQGPRLDDLTAPQLEFGGKVPRLHGTVWCTLSPRWWSGLRESTVNSGGKGVDSTVDNFVYHCDLFGVLGEVDLDKYPSPVWTRIRIDGKVVATRLGVSTLASLLAATTTDQWSDVELFTGAAAQAPWSVMEAVEGVGSTNAYRGQLGFAFTNLLLDNGRRPSLIEVEIATLSTGSYSTTGPGGFVAASDGSGYLPTMPGGIQAGDAIVLTVLAATPTFFPVFTNGWDTASVFTQADGSGNAALSTYLRTATGDADDDDTAYTINGGTATPALWSVIVLRGTIDGHYPGSWTASDFQGGTEAAGFNIDPRQVVKSAGDHFVIAAGAIIAESAAGASFTGVPAGYTEAASQTATAFGTWRLRLSAAYALVNGTTLNPGHFSDGNGAYGSGGFTASTFAITYSPIGAATGITPLAVDLQDVLESEMLRCAPLTAARIDMSPAAGYDVWGFKASNSAAKDIAVLLDWYYFELFCDDKIRLVRRGGASEQTIAFGYSGAGLGGPGEPFAGLVRDNDNEVPVRTAVQYTNLLADGEADTRMGLRIAQGGKVSTIAFPLYTKPTEAQGRANTITQDARVAAHRASVRLGAIQAAKVQPGSVLTLTDNKGNTYRTRVQRLVWNGGVYEADVVLDDANILTEVGIAAEPDSRVIDPVPPPEAEFLALDLPRLQGADDGPAYLALVKTTDSATGARWFDSPDDFNSPTAQGDFANDASFGTVTAASGSFNRGPLFDEASSLTVSLGTDAAPASATRAALLADRRLNAFAVGVNGRLALGQFRTATALGAGVWRFTGLVNMGARGTEAHCAAIVAGDSFALLGTAGSALVPRALDQLGVPFYVKAVALGRSLTSVTALAFTCEGLNLTPLAPVGARAARPSSGDITLSWLRRTRHDTRFGGPLGDACPLGEASERYRVRLYSDATYTTLVRDLGTVTAANATYTAAQRATDGHTLANPLYLDVRMLSDAVGEGAPLQAAA